MGAKEAKQAYERGAIVLPMMSTEGASAGMFDFPRGALEQPTWISDHDWSLMKDKSDPHKSAVAVVGILRRFHSYWETCPETALEQFQRNERPQHRNGPHLNRSVRSMGVLCS